MIAKNKLSNDVKLYLEEIAERLYSGHASIMVGAGFSKNAIGNSASKSFPSWNELADVFYKKLNGSLPSNTEHYLNPLKLAEEVQATFGRPSLEKIISTEVPDIDYIPSHLHDDLIALPWNDIFTTNYDTLLERSAEKANRRFDIVVNQKDLVYSQRPRIIKLHGSFPSNKPFIITEEDYRTYPSEYALFVNTVQQSLIENTLCLIGFSGDDPNFLHWIGWIRDNLGASHSPPIYLIGAFDLPISKIKLLEQKNITVVNLLDSIPNESLNPKKALEFLVDFLKSKKRDESKLDWPSIRTTRAPTHTEDQNVNLEEIAKVTAEWTLARNDYPGWIVCPLENREKLWRETESWIHGKHLALQFPSPLDIDFWFELSWRLNKCLQPLYDHLVKPIQKVINHYYPFRAEGGGNAEIRFEVHDVDNNLYWENIKSKWVYLSFSLLRSFREDGEKVEWQNLSNRLLLIQDELSPEQIIKFLYEQSLYFLFQHDIPSLKTSLKALESRESTPFDETKRAGLLAELGSLDEAKLVLEKSLQSLRAQLNLKPITSDYSLVSQEAYTLQLLKFIKDSLSWTSADGVRDLGYDQEYVARWNHLKQYKCDPWEELNSFRLRLDVPPQEFESVKRTSGFDIGSAYVTHNYRGMNPEITNSYSFLRYIEDIGIPYHAANVTFGREPALGAIKRILEFSPNWAMVTFFRVGSEKSGELFFNRQALGKTSYGRVNDLISLCLSILQDTKPELEKSKTWNDSNIGTHFADFIPEILSRLCVKASLANLQKILDLALEIYKSEHRHKYKNVNNLIGRVIEAWPIASYAPLLEKILDNYVIIDSNHPLIQLNFPDPLGFVDIEKAKMAISTIDIDKSLIDVVIRSFENSNEQKKDSLFFRLSLLFEIGALNSEQIIKFKTLLWSNIGQDGFPLVTTTFHSDFLRVPCPEEVDVFALYRNFVLNIQFPVVGDKKSITIGRTQDECQDILNAFYSFHDKIEWSTQDAKIIFEKILSWWNLDKKLVQKKEKTGLSGSGDELQRRFYRSGRVVGKVVLPYLNDDDFNSLRNTILNLLDEMSLEGISTSEARTSLAIRSTDLSDAQFLFIKNEVLSSDRYLSSRGVLGLIELANHKNNNNSKNALSLLIECLKWRKFPTIIAVIANLSYLVNQGVDLLGYMNDIQIALECLAVESSPTFEENDISPDDKLQARLYLASFANTLYHFLINNGESIPSSILIWKNICHDVEEFAEIRNEWIE